MTPGDRYGSARSVRMGVRDTPPGAPIAAPAEPGFSCTPIAIELATKVPSATELLHALHDAQDGPHVALLTNGRARNPLVLYQADRCLWHDGLYPREQAYEWQDLFHALGRTVGMVAAMFDTGALGLEHPTGGGWRYRSGGSFLEGIGMALDEAGVRQCTLYLGEHERENDALRMAFQALNSEQRSAEPPQPRPVAITEVRNAAERLGVALESGTDLRVWRIVL